MKNLKCNGELLISQGWRYGWQNFDSCRICNRGGFDIFGWRSPAYAFYHDHCLLKSSRYARILKKANKTKEAA